MASEYLAAVLPTNNQKPCLKILLTNMDFNMEICSNTASGWHGG